MEDFEKIPRFVLFIPLMTLFSLGSFFWTGSGSSTIVKTSSNDLEIPLSTFRIFNTQPPLISARSALVLNSSKGTILFSKNPNLRFSPASATKIMTAYVVLEHFSLGDVLIVGQEKIEGSTMRLIPGERISVESLLYGLLLNSGNDAALALAENYPGGIEAFVAKMNETTKQLGLTNTYFSDPAGLSDDGNFTTTLDLAKLAQAALKNETFAKIIRTREKTVFDVTGQIQHQLQNLNRLLWEIPGVVGVKTGFTEGAGGVLVTSFMSQDKQFITIVFKSEDRFADTKTLIRWVLEAREKE